MRLRTHSVHCFPNGEIMKPIEFPQQNVIFAKDQKEYIPLPAYQNDKEAISLWTLTIRERLKLLFTGRLWLRQYNFRGPLQPQRPDVNSPFLKQPVRIK